ncbi:MAG TPA: EAL domain-containing protein [Steroidobacteraceae bacterium]|nr:EAL domain-containing protein [Steroidobacteraceae bacterium]
MTSDAPKVDEIRVLIVDDIVAIHEDFRLVLADVTDHEVNLAKVEELLFGDSGEPTEARPVYLLDYATQGHQGAEYVRRAVHEGRPYAMAFVDMRMPPGWDGLETIERIWAVDPDMQVVICSAHSDYDWNEVVARLGHTDKLLILKKPFEPIEVKQCASALTRKWQQERALRAHVDSLERAIFERTQSLEAANQQLRHLATHDALTNLPNRVLLDDRLAQAIAHSDRDQEPFAVMVVDLDQFKLINDSMGHFAGDEVLSEVARRLDAAARKLDTVARIGGDEFVLIVSPSPTIEDTREFGRQLNLALQAPIRLHGADLRISASIGVAHYPVDGSTAALLLSRADAAMYCAKQFGRNNLQCYSAHMNATTIERVNLLSDLHKALSLHQFRLHYQPKVDTATGDIRGAEALIRWQHPTRGLLAPDEFIPLAEECGLINDIGAWVLREACRQCKTWQAAGLPALRIAVNVSASQFRQGGLLDLIRDALQSVQLDARCLELEMTESAVMTNPEESARILEQVSRMGVVVSVDDFGTGYSSMSYLRRFPIDKLKIDRSFIKDLMTHPDDASIVQAIISLAHGLRLKVVAEGVETAAQLQLLRSLNCDQYQGFQFCAALPADDFGAMVQTWQREADAASDQEAARTNSKLANCR